MTLSTTTFFSKGEGVFRERFLLSVLECRRTQLMGGFEELVGDALEFCRDTCPKRERKPLSCRLVAG
jgi:hypothetical protein